MAGETIITVVGNLTADPELRYTQNGLPVANFTIASTPRTFNKQTGEFEDGEALFLRSSIWRDYAEHVAGTLTKGMRVIAQGNLKQRSYETKEGEKRTAIEFEVQEIGPALRYATAHVTRVQSNGGGQQGGQAAYGAPQGASQAQYGAPQGAPQAQYGAPQGAPQAYPAPQGPVQQAPAQQAPQAMPPQAAPQGAPQGVPPQSPAWSQPTAFGDDTPF